VTAASAAVTKAKAAAQEAELLAAPIFSQAPFQAKGGGGGGARDGSVFDARCSGAFGDHGSGALGDHGGGRDGARKAGSGAAGGAAQHVAVSRAKIERKVQAPR